MVVCLRRVKVKIDQEKCSHVRIHGRHDARYDAAPIASLDVEFLEAESHHEVFQNDAHLGMEIMKKSMNYKSADKCRYKIIKITPRIRRV